MHRLSYQSWTVDEVGGVGGEQFRDEGKGEWVANIGSSHSLSLSHTQTHAPKSHTLGSCRWWWWWWWCERVQSFLPLVPHGLVAVDLSELDVRAFARVVSDSAHIWPSIDHCNGRSSRDVWGFFVHRRFARPFAVRWFFQPFKGNSPQATVAKSLDVS